MQRCATGVSGSEYNGRAMTCLTTSGSSIQMCLLTMLWQHFTTDTLGSHASSQRPYLTRCPSGTHRPLTVPCIKAPQSRGGVMSGEPLLLSNRHGILHVTVHVPSVRHHMLWSGLPCQAHPHDTPAWTPIILTVQLPLFSPIQPLIVPWPHCLALPLCLVIPCSVGYI
ncbi:unnamed protein product [Mycena citricolor]|uniref:Uncharacterized protein n=1 Tax=Mycena citricolor TaxID=2018698 RepID=A0AAD2H313_9AGAR|nr:unnamed protein product [Mycena citricolor]CAK5268296.1 unnamed protein product [Mycena citricolor]